MKIISYEWKKIISSPIIVVLLTVFIGFNLFLISSQFHVKEELTSISKIAELFGHEINEEMTAELEVYYQKELEKLQQLIFESNDKTYESAAAFLSEKGYYLDEYSKEEQAFISDLIMLENYRYLISTIDETYAAIDLKSIAEKEIAKYQLSGAAAQTIAREYEKLEARLERLKENEEHKHLFFYGPIYKMHSFLFKSLFRTILFECLIIVVLLTSFIVNYEFESKTHLLAYSSKRGRNLLVDKFTAAILASLFVTTILLGSSLLLYFLFYDYSLFWHVPISNFFTTEYNFFYITWWKMSILQFLLWSITLLYICQLLFTAITFILSRFIRNSYYVFFVFAIVFGLALLLPGWMSNTSNLVFAAGFTPFALILNPHLWFMGTGAHTIFPYYEVGTAIVWLTLLTVVSFVCIKSFKNMNIQ